MSIQKDQIGKWTTNADGTKTQTNTICDASGCEAETYTVDEAKGLIYAEYEDGGSETFKIVAEGTEGAQETAQGYWGIHVN